MGIYEKYIGYYFAQAYQDYSDKKIHKCLGTIVGTLEGYWLIETIEPEGAISHTQRGICSGIVTDDMEIAEEYMARRIKELEEA